MSECPYCEGQSAHVPIGDVKLCPRDPNFLDEWDAAGLANAEGAKE